MVNDLDLVLGMDLIKKINNNIKNITVRKLTQDHTDLVEDLEVGIEPLVV